MAVPKRKTSKARRDKRRATHSLEAPRVNAALSAGRPSGRTASARPAAPTRAARSSRSSSTRRSGLDGPRASLSTRSAATVHPTRWSRARPRPPRTASRVDHCTARRGLDTRGLSSSSRPDRIEMARQAGRGGARQAGQLARRGRSRRRGDGHADAVVSAGNTGAMLAAGLAAPAAPPRRHPARDRRPAPDAPRASRS